MGHDQARVSGLYRGPRRSRSFRAARGHDIAAFRECADARLGTRYKNCDDPNGSDARTVQIAKVLKALERNNPLEYTCSYALNDGTSAKANYAPWGEHGVKTIDLADDWMESFSDWSWYRGVQPFNWRSSDILHEFMHTHNYKHPDSGCPADYKAGGIEPSAPYIIGDCVANVIEESATVCSVFGAPTGALSLVTHLKENTSGTQTCETVFDPGLRVALRTSGGQYLRAVNGGGTVVDAQATAQGPWETVYVIDMNGGPLWSGESVRIKTKNGHYLARSADGSLAAVMPANDQDGPTFIISRPGGGTAEFGPGDQVQLRSGASYVTAENGGGGAVSVNRREGREWETFTMVGTRRANVVRLVTEPGRKTVYVRPDGRLDAASVTTDEPSAFWVVDHNGGTLQSGDEVTFETLRSSKFVGVCQAGSESLTATAGHDAGLREIPDKKSRRRPHSAWR